MYFENRISVALVTNTTKHTRLDSAKRYYLAKQDWCVVDFVRSAILARNVAKSPALAVQESAIGVDFALRLRETKALQCSLASWTALRGRRSVHERQILP